MVLRSSSPGPVEVLDLGEQCSLRGGPPPPLHSGTAASTQYQPTASPVPRTASCRLAVASSSSRLAVGGHHVPQPSQGKHIARAIHGTS